MLYMWLVFNIRQIYCDAERPDRSIIKNTGAGINQWDDVYVKDWADAGGIENYLKM